MPYFIFITGASGSGKTTLATKLLEELQQKNIDSSLLSMDNYFQPKPANIKSAKEIQHFRTVTNFDVPEQVDFTLFHEHIKLLAKGITVDVPTYSFPIADRTGETNSFKPRDIIIIEGNFALYKFNKMNLASDNSLKIFVEADSYLTYKKRRLIRDPQQRNMTKAMIDYKETKQIVNAFFQYIRPSGQVHADLFITNNHMIDVNSDLDNIENAFSKDLTQLVSTIVKHTQKDDSSLFNLKNILPIALSIESALFVIAIINSLNPIIQLCLAASMVATSLLMIININTAYDDSKVTYS